MGATVRQGGRAVKAPAGSPPASGQVAVWDGAAQQWIYSHYGERNAVQAADQSSVSQVMVSATDLVLPVEANKTYKLNALLCMSIAGATSGYRLTVTGPAAPTNLFIASTGENTTTSFGQQPIITFATVMAFACNAGIHQVFLDGTLINGANAGNLQIQFCQNVVDAANAVTLKAISRFTLTKLSS